MKLKIMYIVNGMGFTKRVGIGGSDKRVAEIGRRLQERNVEVCILTTRSGQEVLKKEGLASNFLLISNPFSFFERLESSSIGRVFSYSYEILKSLKVKPQQGMVVYSSSDFLCDTIPAYMFKKQSKNIKLVLMIHHLIKVPWKRGGSFLANLLNYVSQQISFRLLRRQADLILVYDTLEGKRIKEYLITIGYSSRKIKMAMNGIDFGFISQIPAQEKVLDACFIGGLRPSKGIFDLPLIWNAVCEVKKSAKLVIIGGGSEKYVTALKKDINNRQLGNNLIMTGSLSRTELFSKVKQCEIFLSPSHEEGWGIAVCEAMCCGLPAVVYNLQAYSPFNNVIIKVPIGSIDQFAMEILKLLDDPDKREKIGEKAKEFIKRYDWDTIAEEELKSLRKLTSL